MDEDCKSRFTSLAETATHTTQKELTNMGIYRLPATISLLAYRVYEKISVSLRFLHVRMGKTAMVATVLYAFSGVACFGAGTTVNVYLPDAKLQADFIANATTYYKGTITKSPFFAGTYTITITTKNVTGPVVVSSPILTGTAFQECIVYGFANGMDYERQENLSIAQSFQDQIVSSQTCGGFISSTPAELQPFLRGCSTAYDVFKSTVTRKMGLPPWINP